jgi:tetratricopeptide (TPR) repeat protein
MRSLYMQRKHGGFFLLAAGLLLWGCVTYGPAEKPKAQNQIFFEESLHYGDGSIELFRIGDVSFKWAAMTRATEKGLLNNTAAENLDIQISLFSQEIKDNPKDINAHLQRAGLLYERDASGDLDQAIIDCNNALAINDREMAAYYVRGLIYAKQRNYTAAISDFWTIINANEYKAIGIKYILGQLYYEQGNLDMAAEALEEVYRIDSKFADVETILDFIRQRQ